MDKDTINKQLAPICLNTLQIEKEFDKLDMIKKLTGTRAQYIKQVKNIIFMLSDVVSRLSNLEKELKDQSPFYPQIKQLREMDENLILRLNQVRKELNASKAIKSKLWHKITELAKRLTNKTDWLNRQEQKND